MSDSATTRDDMLSVWLRGKRIGELQRLRNRRMRLRFAESALAEHGAGSQVLSLSLPLTPKRVEGPLLDSFIRGLLPELGVRAMIEQENRIAPGDDFELLRAIGAECAGAVQFLPVGGSPSDGLLRALTPDEVNGIVRGLPTIETPDALPISASLGGVQAKILLAKTATGWAWPAFGAASTHIIKPEPLVGIVVEHLIEAEYWTSLLARASGLEATLSELQDFDGRRAIVIERYDRLGGRRRHQEDFAQALGLDIRDKYELGRTYGRGGGAPNRLLRIARLADAAAIDPSGFKESLLKTVVFNAVIGNSDAHSKNYSLLIDGAGEIRLAPIYDAAPVLLMNRNLTTSGHTVGGQADLRYVTRDHLEREAVSWGIDGGRAARLIDTLADAVQETVDTIPLVEQLRYLPELIRTRTKQLRAGTVMRHIA